MHLERFGLDSCLKMLCILINEMQPKRVGSRKFKKVSKPLKPHLVIRWIEPADGFGGPGVLYGWYPAPKNQEPQATDIDNDCYTNSIICQVAVTIEVDVELGFERFRVSQEESSRVEATGSCESSNEGDSSSDGVDIDGEMQIDVAEQSVAFWMLVRLVEG